MNNIDRPLSSEELLKLVNDMELQVSQPSNSEVNHSTKKTVSRKKRSVWSYIKRTFLSLTLISVTIPSTIILLPKLAVYYSNFNFKPFISLALSILIILCIWLICFTGISFLLTGRFKINKFVKHLMMYTLVGYLGFSTLFLNNANVKDPKIKETYLNLHPVLRVGLTTLILADTDLIITDTKRTKEDYVKWGLSPKERSHHYIQKETGFVHAVDIRTIGRPEWQNKLVDIGFRMMGFKTLRHVGTADHLHVYLPLNK